MQSPRVLATDRNTQTLCVTFSQIVSASVLIWDRIFYKRLGAAGLSVSDYMLICSSTVFSSKRVQ